MAKLTLDKQIEKLQKEAWGTAELCDTNQMPIKDQIFEQGLMLAETDCLKKNETDEEKREYINVLQQAKLFYTRTARKQQVM